MGKVTRTPGGQLRQGRRIRIPIVGSQRKKTATSLIERLHHPAFEYPNRRRQFQRLRFVIEQYGDQIPRIYIAIMFGRHPESVTERLRRSFPQRTRSDGISLFASWIREDKIYRLTMLSHDERRYLTELRQRVVLEYAKRRFRDPREVAAERAEELRRAAKRVAKSVPRATCSRDDCTNVFPVQGQFFPNLAKGGKRAGRCAVCAYLKKAQARRRWTREGPTRSRGTVLTSGQRKRFWQIERRLRLELPTRVLAAMFHISRSTVNHLRKKPFTRSEGKAVFHRFQKKPEPPQFEYLSPEENSVVAAQWRAIRDESSLFRVEYPTPEDHIAELLGYTQVQLRLVPDYPLRTCIGCGNSFAADERCFPYARRRGQHNRGEKYLRDYCRACYAKQWE